MYPNCMPDMILAHTVLQIFCWQSCFTIQNAKVGKGRKVCQIFTEFYQKLVGWLCWGLTSQSTIFQSCRDGAIASWVINQYFRGVKCLAQGHNTVAVGLELRTSRSGVRHSTTEPPLPKVNQITYTMAKVYMPNIMILAQAVIQIFCWQGSIGLQC